MSACTALTPAGWFWIPYFVGMFGIGYWLGYVRQVFS